jgi:hypothetical protein
MRVATAFNKYVQCRRISCCRRSDPFVTGSQRTRSAGSRLDMETPSRGMAFARGKKLAKLIASVALFGMMGVLKAATTSASFGVSMVILPTCTVSAGDVALKVACVANGVVPLLVLGDTQHMRQTVVDDETRNITITY